LTKLWANTENRIGCSEKLFILNIEPGITKNYQSSIEH